MAKYDPVMKRILTQVAEEEDLPFEEIEQVYRGLFRAVKAFLQLRECPRILIDNFGTFRVSYYRISRKISVFINRYKSDKISRKKAVALVSYFWPVRRRVQSEFYSRSHKRKGSSKTKNQHLQDNRSSEEYKQLGK